MSGSEWHILIPSTQFNNWSEFKLILFMHPVYRRRLPDVIYSLWSKGIPWTVSASAREYTENLIIYINTYTNLRRCFHQSVPVYSGVTRIEIKGQFTNKKYGAEVFTFLTAYGNFLFSLISVCKTSYSIHVRKPS